MTEKTAASAATAKLCRNESTIAIPVDIADQIVSIADNSIAVISDYRDSIINGSVRDGLWISDENAALDLATAIAAMDGLRAVVREFGQPDEDPGGCCDVEAAPYVDASTETFDLRTLDGILGMSQAMELALTLLPPGYVRDELGTALRTYRAMEMPE